MKFVVGGVLQAKNNLMATITKHYKIMKNTIFQGEGLPPASPCVRLWFWVKVHSRDGTSRLRRDFGVPRRDTRLYISCFSLSRGCGARIGSWSRMFFGGVGTELVFLICRNRSRFFDVLELVSDSTFSLATQPPIFDKLLETIVTSSERFKNKQAKIRRVAYLDRSFFGL